MICINLKTYPNNSGSGTYNVLDQISEFATKNPDLNDKFAFCPNNYQLESVLKTYPSLNVVAQHTEAIDLGKTTGHIPAELLKLLGVKFTLLNHSEHRVYDEKILEKIDFIKKFGINVIVCCENQQEAAYIMQAKPYAIAYEPPELIGSDISVSTQKPEIVKEFVELVKDNSLPYIGAGITGAEDIRIGTKLGAKGFLIAKAFLDAQDKPAKLQEFISAMKLTQ